MVSAERNRYCRPLLSLFTHVNVEGERVQTVTEREVGRMRGYVYVHESRNRCLVSSRLPVSLEELQKEGKFDRRLLNSSTSATADYHAYSTLACSVPECRKEELSLAKTTEDLVQIFRCTLCTQKEVRVLKSLAWRASRSQTSSKKERKTFPLTTECSEVARTVFLCV